MRQTQAAVLLGLIIVLPFAGSVVAAFLRSHARDAASWLAGTIMVLCASLVASLYPFAADGGSASIVCA